MAHPESGLAIAHEHIVIAPEGDLTVEFTVCHDFGLDRQIYKTPRPAAHASIRVDKAKLEKFSAHFKDVFDEETAKGNTDKFALWGYSVKGIELWLRVFHAHPAIPSIDGVYPADIWHAIVTGYKYEFSLPLMGPWFTAWYAQKLREILGCPLYQRQLLLPCYVFDLPNAFSGLTLWLAYNTPGHNRITEVNPTTNGFNYLPVPLGLPDTFMSEINSARISIRNLLYQGLLSQIEYLEENSKCECVEPTLYRFCLELKRIKIWPVHHAIFHTYPAKDIIFRLGFFDGNNVKPSSASAVLGAASTTTAPSENTPAVGAISTTTNTTASTGEKKLATDTEFTAAESTSCKDNRDWDASINDLRLQAKSLFDGLCLHCIDDGPVAAASCLRGHGPVTQELSRRVGPRSDHALIKGGLAYDAEGVYISAGAYNSP